MPLFSNLATFLELSKESLGKSIQETKAHRRPKPDGSPGFIITYDPDRKSFKHALVAVVFAGIYLDALLYIEGCNRLGELKYKKIDKKKNYEGKLKIFGISDSAVLNACKRLRESRNELVHEKAVDLSSRTTSKSLWAQKEAQHAVDFIETVPELLASVPK